jgi:two-component system, NtrC family, response regulator AtoC
MSQSPVQSILVIDDEQAITQSLKYRLQHLGYEIDTAGDAQQALEHLQAKDFGLVLLDVRMPHGSGLDMITPIRRISPDTLIIVITGYGTFDMVVQAMKLGAVDFITKPFDPERLNIAVRNAFECRRLTAENASLRKAIEHRHPPETLIGISPAILELHRLIGKVAETDSTVLVSGESGTGKELVALALHHQNHSRTGPFVAVSCGAIAENLLESEFFGHEKGAFTGAIAARAGRFELAHKGTIFLDEVGELSQNLQVKLLRVLQERSFERVGSSKTRAVDVRVISATNRDLEQEVEEGRFREDLYYRLNVIPITLPPLRSRPEDIPILIRHFLDRVNRLSNATTTGVTPEALRLLQAHQWPGNVRELENLIARVVALKESGPIDVDDLPASIRQSKKSEGPAAGFSFPPQGIDLPCLIDELEHDLIEKALALSHGVKSRAAELLGLNRTTLVEKIRRG